jgi:hypothetical protein
MSEDKNLNFTFCGQYLIDIQDPKIYISNINKPCPINQLPQSILSSAMIRREKRNVNGHMN